MIFKPVLLEAIFDGHKTVTRRPVDGDRPCKWEVGKTYAILPGMARNGVGRIRIERVVRESLGDIDDRDAGYEGFPNRQAFVDYWCDLYGEFDPMLPVWRIAFELVEQTHTICACCGGAGVQPVAGVER